MHVGLRVVPSGTVADLDKRKDLVLVTNDTEVTDLKHYIAGDPFIPRLREKLDDFGGFFVKVEDGEYTEIYGFSGSVAYTYKTIYRVTPFYRKEKGS